MRTLFTNQSAYKNLLLWLIGEAIVGVFFYAFVSHLPDFAQSIILLVAIVVIWYRVDFPKRTTRIDATLPFWLPIALGLFCGVRWKITDEDVWVRLGIICICVRAVTEFSIGRAGGPPTVSAPFLTKGKNEISPRQ
jgi:hypothetical protein